MADFTHAKFRIANDTSHILRRAALQSGCPVTFKVSGVDLSTLASEKRFPNFDAESDSLLQELEDASTAEQVNFEWIGSGFHRM